MYPYKHCDCGCGIASNGCDRLKLNTYGLGDVIFGNEKRMKIDDHKELHDVFLDFHVLMLSRCLVPHTGWTGNARSYINLLEDPQGSYHRYLEKNKKQEDNNEESFEKAMAMDDILSKKTGSKIFTRSMKDLKNNMKKKKKKKKKKKVETTTSEDNIIEPNIFE